MRHRLGLGEKITIFHQRIIKVFLQSGSQTVLVFPYQRGWQYSDGDPLTGALNARGV